MYLQENQYIFRHLELQMTKNTIETIRQDKG